MGEHDHPNLALQPTPGSEAGVSEEHEALSWPQRGQDHVGQGSPSSHDTSGRAFVSAFDAVRQSLEVDSVWLR